MKIIFGQPVEEVAVESPIVFGGMKLHEGPIWGRGVLEVMFDSDLIYMKFGMEIEFDVLNDFPKFGCDQLISCLIGARTMKFSQRFSLVCAITVDVIAQCGRFLTNL